MTAVFTDHMGQLETGDIQVPEVKDIRPNSNKLRDGSTLGKSHFALSRPRKGTNPYR